MLTIFYKGAVMSFYVGVDLYSDNGELSEIRIIRPTRFFCRAVYANFRSSDLLGRFFAPTNRLSV